MFRKRAYPERLVMGCLLLISICRLATAQHHSADTISLARIEQSIEQGKAIEVEKPLLDYAVAHPTDVQALELLGRVRYQQGRFDEAHALYQRVLALDPSHVRAKIDLGHILYESGRRDEARLLLLQATQTSPADPRVALALANALLLVGEFERALAAVDKLPAAWKNLDALPVAAASYLALGDRQRFVALIPSMRKAAVMRPIAAVQCAEVLQRAGMAAEAFGLLRSALGAAPNNTNALILMGRLETQLQDYAPARRHLNRAAMLAPLSADVFAALAALDGAQGNLTAALDSLNRARSLAPTSVPVLAQFVVTAMRANRPQAAADAAGTLIRLRPDEPEFIYLFGAAALQSGNLSAAQNALERYVRERPEDSRGCLALGISLAGQHDQSEAARAQFERCLQVDPANVEAKYQLSLVFKAQGEMGTAIQLLEEVTTRAPRHADALRDLGTLYLQTKADAKARAVLERAVTIAPQDAETHFQLSRLYNRLGESALAARHLELFRQLKIQREKGNLR